eukprot:11329599-Heterocapsa_arctica.AAC.1
MRTTGLRDSISGHRQDDTDPLTLSTRRRPGLISRQACKNTGAGIDSEAFEAAASAQAAWFTAHAATCRQSALVAHASPAT